MTALTLRDASVIGFTGTRDGMTLEQQDATRRLLWTAMPGVAWLHHGDCVGADLEAHRLARLAGLLVEVHPPLKRDLRAFCVGDRTRAPLPYLTRDQAIVDACEVLIAAPGGFAEEARSGTWATVRFARRAGKRRLIVWPNGVVKEEKDDG